MHVKFISQLNCEDEHQMALNLELKATWNWPLELEIVLYLFSRKQEIKVDKVQFWFKSKIVVVSYQVHNAV